MITSATQNDVCRMTRQVRSGMNEYLFPNIRPLDEARMLATLGVMDRHWRVFGAREEVMQFGDWLGRLVRAEFDGDRFRTSGGERGGPDLLAEFPPAQNPRRKRVEEIVRQMRAMENQAVLINLHIITYRLVSRMQLGGEETRWMDWEECNILKTINHGITSDGPDGWRAGRELREIWPASILSGPMSYPLPDSAWRLTEDGKSRHYPLKGDNIFNPCAYWADHLE